MKDVDADADQYKHGKWNTFGLEKADADADQGECNFPNSSLTTNENEDLTFPSQLPNSFFQTICRLSDLHGKIDDH